jgi:cytochrome bd-type quinol oxidase subunit 1
VTGRRLLALDVVAVIAFVVIGRRNHDEGGDFLDVVGTAAPFLIGLVAGWLVARADRDPSSVRTGVVVASVTVAAGMLLRHFVFGDGTALSFVIVATVFLGLTLVGWRALATLRTDEAARSDR